MGTIEDQCQPCTYTDWFTEMKVYTGVLVQGRHLTATILRRSTCRLISTLIVMIMITNITLSDHQHIVTADQQPITMFQPITQHTSPPGHPTHPGNTNHGSAGALLNLGIG